LGVGVGNYNANFTYYARELGLSHEAGAAHNLYLEIAAERGILGLLAFLAIIYSTFRVLNSTKRMALNKNFKEFAAICDALSTGLTGYLVAATFLHDAHIRYFWVLLGIAWSVPQVLNSLAGRSYKTESLRSLRAIYND
jgi:O-antigen ligase